MAGRDYLTIGEVVERLRPRYTDLSISKVRFLEEESLIGPERTPGGYRKFATRDVERIEAILRLQKDYFLPLAVIREKLADMDRGRVPDELKGDATVTAPTGRPAVGESVPLESASQALGVPDAFLRELLDYGLVTTHAGDEGPELGPSDVQIAHTAWDLRRYGVEPRHLRMYDNLAEREAALFGQILTPAYRHNTAESKARLAATLADITKATGDLKRELLRRALASTFDGML
jgi:DNA-binding transcriptional MerR regulator